MTTTISAMLAPGQAQANDFSDWSCKNIPFADKVCHTVEATNKAIDFASDPLGYIAQFFNNAVTSIFTQMMKALGSTTRIDWQDPGFLRTYTMAFAASSLLTVILWLIAVAKRALQGVPPLQALGESIGFLLMSVVVSAFAPAAVAYVVMLFDSAAEAMFKPVAGDAGNMVVTVTTAMLALMAIPGGQIIVIFFCLAMLAAIAGVWLELIVRNALIMCGLVFGPTVFSGLVDRDLWSHSKRWVAVVVAIIASKYVTFTAISLGTGMLASDSPKASLAQSFATVFTALAILGLAMYMPFQLTKFIPILGDEIQGMYQARDELKGKAQNLGSQAGDSFGELTSRFGGGGESEGDGEGEEGAEADGDALSQGGGGGGLEAGGAEGATAATGVGAGVVAAKKGADKVKDETKAAAERGVDGATAGLDSGGSSSSSGGGADGGGDSVGNDFVTGSSGGSGDSPVGDAPPDAGPPSWPPVELPEEEPPSPPPDEVSP
ncbi:hypothetical protein [Streptomyces hygroscopicus]|uniref:hypothetical protein n=1 Tax=Streptomyces hygroscopicus TaxID=1912 RepID=UPI001FCB6D68|nr:hypothetical protein [Streptomyces hygroscopicus]